MLFLRLKDSYNFYVAIYDYFSELKRSEAGVITILMTPPKSRMGYKDNNFSLSSDAIKRVCKIVDKQELEASEKMSKLKKIDAEFHINRIHTRAIKYINAQNFGKIEVGNGKTTKGHIEKFTIVEPAFGEKYLLIINDNYQDEPIIINIRYKYWKLFKLVYVDEQIEDKDSWLGQFDYFNSNENNPFISKGYEKTKIFRGERKGVQKNISVEKISIKAYKTRRPKT
jgi:hypothetical protein